MGTSGVGQVGVGMLGREFIPHLAKAYGPVTVFDTDAARMRAAVGASAVGASSPREVAARSRLIVLSLPDPDAVRGVMLGEDGVLAGADEGALVIDTTTGEPWTSRAVHDAAGARGVEYLDAPVTTPSPGTTGVEAARAGEAMFMVGADDHVFARAEPVLALLGKHVFHMGPVGNGNIMKLVTNYIAGIGRVAVAEGLVLAAAAGLPAERAVEVCRHSVAQSASLEETAAKILGDDPDSTGFAIELRHKDYRLVAELARRLDTPLFMNGVALALYQAMLSQGLGARDVSHVVRYLADMAGVDVLAPQGARDVARKD